MAVTAEKLDLCDPIWSALRDQAEELAANEPALASFVHATVLKHERLEDALSYHLAKQDRQRRFEPMLAREIFEEALEADPANRRCRARRPVGGVRARSGLPFLCAGVPVLQGLPCAGVPSHRPLAVGRRSATTLALFLQSRMSELFAVDIHPAAQIGRGIFMDHATGIVIGETAVVEDDVSMLHGVTLGGTGKENGDRHPKIRRGVMLSVGAEGAGQYRDRRIFASCGAGSVVLKSRAGALHGRRACRPR